jgi:hypothetical protein
MSCRLEIGNTISSLRRSRELETIKSCKTLSAVV